MFRNARSLAFAGLLSLFVLPAIADDLPKSFEEAAALGDAQERAASTKDYFSQTLMPYYGQKYAGVLQSCFTTVAKPDGTPFAFVAAIGTDGRIVRLYHHGETNIFICMRDALEKDVFPPPPTSPYYLHIAMNFTDKDGPERSAEENVPPLIVEPGTYSYTVGVPAGWEYNFEQAQELGTSLVLFPKGGSFRTSNSIVYVTEIKDPAARIV